MAKLIDSGAVLAVSYDAGSETSTLGFDQKSLVHRFTSNNLILYSSASNTTIATL